MFFLLVYSSVFGFHYQDVTKELKKCKEEGAERLDLSKSQVFNILFFYFQSKIHILAHRYGFLMLISHFSYIQFLAQGQELIAFLNISTYSQNILFYENEHKIIKLFHSKIVLFLHGINSFCLVNLLPQLILVA